MSQNLNVFSSGAAKLANTHELLQAWQEGRAVHPITLEIQPSERCNHHCPGCQSQYALGRREARRRAHTGAFLNLELLHTIWEAPPSGIVLSGNTGDPLLHPEIGKLITKIQEESIPLVVISNGQAITEELALLLVRACTGIRVSLDAFDAATFRQTHGAKVSDWFQVLQGVSFLMSARDAMKLSSQECLIGVGYLTKEGTRGGMVPATRLAKGLGVDYIQFRPFHYDNTIVSKDIEECQLVADPPRFRVMASHQKYDRQAAPIRTYTRCAAAWFYTVLDAQGDFYLCCHHVGNTSARIGDIRKQSWQDFVQSGLRRSMIDSFSTASCLPLCRLDSENEMLTTLQNGERGDAPPLTTEIQRHAMFV